MRKLLIIVLLIVGCDETTAPEIVDCAGVAGGGAVEDNCGTCDADSSNDNTTCTQDCAGEWGGDAVSRLMGDIDGDGYITGECCEQASCQNNPEYDSINPPCDGPVGDAYAILAIEANYGGLGCGEWEEGEGIPSAENCPDFYWIDVNGDDEITSGDAGCVAQLHVEMIVDDCCVPDTSDSPCAGKCVGEECCISE